ncbi:GNAT family N-acetyltransferase [Nocardioides sp. SYSU D00038]|uniref:GNAT family N-acetyltransferase n=1 Tax=Nocardioides sp. SYSU D00038 TaxID=2812554 RepID=UPI001967A8C5|nr:GNAT family N-acetyltransferase [Nocardioides sp. SYSU D00038]
MLWRLRAALPDRPGALASLAAGCGAAGVNILSLQIFPGLETVTDELVVRTADDCTDDDLALLVAAAGGRLVSATACTEAALIDQPTRYVQAARQVVARPPSFPEVVAALLDAEADPEAATGETDVMDLVVGDVLVQLRRRAPFTATEHARGAALADLVSDVLRRDADAPMTTAGARRIGDGATTSYAVDGSTVVAIIDGEVVGQAVVLAPADEPLVRPVTLRVDPAWQRRGIGTRLLVDAARLAHAAGAEEVLLTTRSDNQAVLPMVMAAGLRGRIRMAGDRLVVRVPVRDLKPLRA